MAWFEMAKQIRSERFAPPDGEKDEAEQLAIAMAISLSEREKRDHAPQENTGTHHDGDLRDRFSNGNTFSAYDEDELLARKLHEELNMSLDVEGERHLHPEDDITPSSMSKQVSQMKNSISSLFTNRSSTSGSLAQDRCAACGKPLQNPGSMGFAGLFASAASFSFPSQYIKAMGRKYHPECLRCAGCNQRLTGQFTVAQNSHGAFYHPACHRIEFHPTCCVCGDYIPEEPGGRIVYAITPFWNEKFCRHHSSDGTLRCAACQRLKPRGSDDWAALDDGRSLCLLCLGSVVPDSVSAQPLYHDVLRFFESLSMPLPCPQPPPLHLVEYSTLNEASWAERASQEGRGTFNSSPEVEIPSIESRDGPMFHTRGLCLTEYVQMIHSRRFVEPSSLLGMLFKSVTREHQHAQQIAAGPVQVNVTAILVLKGLPRLLTGCIIAHETMHAWLRLSGYQNLSPKVEEGICQLMALLWLEAQDVHSFGETRSNGGGDGSYEERLASFLGHQIRNDRSEVYGDGLREALDAFQRAGGLQPVLHHVKLTGTLC